MRTDFHTAPVLILPAYADAKKKVERFPVISAAAVRIVVSVKMCAVIEFYSQNSVRAGEIHNARPGAEDVKQGTPQVLSKGHEHRPGEVDGKTGSATKVRNQHRIVSPRRQENMRNNR